MKLKAFRVVVSPLFGCYRLLSSISKTWFSQSTNDLCSRIGVLRLCFVFHLRSRNYSLQHRRWFSTVYPLVCYLRLLLADAIIVAPLLPIRCRLSWPSISTKDRHRFAVFSLLYRMISYTIPKTFVASIILSSSACQLAAEAYIRRLVAVSRIDVSMTTTENTFVPQ